jgi:hypothetical protein
MSMNLLPHRSIAIMVVTALCASSAMAQTTTAGTSTRAPAALSPVDSAALLKDYGSAERIQRSASLRMLSQRISATACNRVAGIGVADADKYLTRSIRDYRRILAGLEDGDNGLGLYGPERDRIVLRDIAKLNELWAPLDSTFDAFDGETLNRDHIVQIAQTVPDMLDTSKALLGFVVAEYSDPTQMLQSDAILLQIAERQRMLEQEIANATCLISGGIEVDAARTMLTEAIPIYEVSLAALRNGMPEAGVASPPTIAIDMWLTDISDRWDTVLPTLTAIGAGGDVSAEDGELVFAEMNKLTWMMNITVGQYTEASKLKQSFEN